MAQLQLQAREYISRCVIGLTGISISIGAIETRYLLKRMTEAFSRRFSLPLSYSWHGRKSKESLRCAPILPSETRI
ncbi:hypothetical protein FIBSPDRAFT_849969 [Athelia psychrophila]|uniref:Uncharacterized protein n=1 Tax=Athelia psychrophila TaxID=1759441 RepID=A0A166TT13_9AGAM|nr:hypothetical protein FIBSPDRAFT_849969 [Fibularhizoctonia sp. CBS 109695]